ncbi:MAG: hypothetical protein KGS61_10675 [Verrucomicrobia bacterium]|nr:hypothetical protein [Verrucomicrobiota bacterium]
MTTINATKTSSPSRPSNIGASANLPRQLPLIGTGFPEIQHAFPGTINLRLEKPLLAMGYDHRTAPIKWQPDESPPETFDFVRVKFEARGSIVDCWLYIPHGSPHRRDLCSHEIITPAQLQISDGDRCVLHIPRQCVSMPYAEFPVIVIV